MQRKEGRKKGSTTRILCIASRVSTRNIFFLREASPFSRRLVDRGIKRPPSFTPAFSLLSAGIHKKSYVLWVGDIPLSKKRQLGLAFDPLVTVNARLRGISRFPLSVYFPGKKFPFFLVVQFDSSSVLLSAESGCNKYLYGLCRIGSFLSRKLFREILFVQ